MVYDEIIYHGGEMKDFQITATLFHICQSAHTKYHDHINREKEEASKIEVGERGNFELRN